MPAPKLGALAAAVASACVLLAGCGGGSGNPAGSPADSTSPKAAAGPMQTTGGTSGTGTKLTGKFCTDFKNIGKAVKIPANATGNLTSLKQDGVPYLGQVAAYFNGLAAEAPPQPAKELRLLASEYQTIARSISSGNVSSLAKAEQQMVSLTTKGAAGDAFHHLIAYMLTNCMSA